MRFEVALVDEKCGRRSPAASGPPKDYAVFAGTQRASGSAIVVLMDGRQKARLPEPKRCFFVEYDGAEDHRTR